MCTVAAIFKIGFKLNYLLLEESCEVSVSFDCFCEDAGWGNVRALSKRKRQVIFKKCSVVKTGSYVWNTTST